MMPNTKKKQNLIIHVVYYLIIVGIAYVIFKYALGIVAPFIIAAIVAMMLNPLIKWISRKLKIKNRIVGVICVILFWIVALALISVILYFVGREAVSLVANNDTLVSSVSNVINQLESWIDNLFASLTGNSSNLLNLDELSRKITETLSNIITNIGKGVGNFALTLPSVLLFIFAMVLSSIFISSDYDNIKKFLTIQLPPKYYSRYIFFKKFIIGTIGKYIKAYGIIMSITFCELLIAFYALGLNYAFLLAIIITIFDLLPYVGCGTVLIPWGIIDLILGNYTRGIGILVAAAVIAVVRNIVEPKVVGKQIGIHPLLVLISIYVGGKILGIFGIIVFPITIIFIKALKDEGYIRAWKSIKEQEDEQAERAAAEKEPDSDEDNEPVKIPGKNKKSD